MDNNLTEGLQARTKAFATFARRPGKTFLQTKVSSQQTDDSVRLPVIDMPQNQSLATLQRTGHLNKMLDEKGRGTEVDQNPGDIVDRLHKGT